MNVLYECDFVVSKDRYLAWGKENEHRKDRLFLKIMWGVLSIFCLGLFLFYKHAIFIIFFLFAVYRAFLRWRLVTSRQYSILAQQYGGENWTRKYVFGDDLIQIQEGNVSVQYVYTDIEKTDVKDGYVRIFLKDRKVLRMYADGFVSGTWDQCREYIMQRCGKI